MHKYWFHLACNCYLPIMGAYLILSIITALLLAQNEAQLRSRGLECFECISYGNEGDSTCETPIVGVTNIVPCSNADDYNVAAKEFLTKWDTLITKIQKQLGGIRAKMNGNNNYNKTVETDQPACVKFSFMSKDTPVVVRGCKLVDIERTTGCLVQPDGKSTKCICVENCVVPNHAAASIRKNIFEIGKIWIFVAIVNHLLTCFSLKRFS